MLMKKIAVLTSGAGEAALRLVNLFNGGDRIMVEFIVTEASSTFPDDKVKEKGATVFHVTASDWNERQSELSDLFKENEISLLVSDGFSLPVPEMLVEAAGGKWIEVSSVEMAPREVVGILEENLRKPVVETPEDPETLLTPEQEWAKSLKINFIPPVIPVTPPPLPSSDESQTVLKDQAGAEGKRMADNSFSEERFSYGNPRGETMNYSHHDYSRENPYNMREHQRDMREPMPPNYLIWAILTTIFCCFIPGIIAIVFSSQVSNRYFSGDIEGAKQSSRLAQIWIIISVVIGVVGATLWLPFMFIGS